MNVNSLRILITDLDELLTDARCDADNDLLLGALARARAELLDAPGCAGGEAGPPACDWCGGVGRVMMARPAPGRISWGRVLADCPRCQGEGVRRAS